MRILLINHYAGSPRHGMEFRPYNMAREWLRLGHEVLIVAATESHVRAQQPSAPLPGATQWREPVEGVPYLWLRTPAYRGNGVGRVVNIAAFCARLWRAAPQLAAEFRPDAVIASSTYPMDIWPARRIARMSGARLVYEVHDLWPLSPIELGGFSRRHPFIVWVQWAEDTAYRSAARVVSMLPNALEHMRARGMPADKFVYVPNGIAPEDWQPTAGALRDDIAAVIEAARARGRLVLGYAGTFGLANALDTLIDAARLLGDVAQVVLVGDGPQRARLAQRVRDEGIDNVAILPAVPKRDVPALLAAFDVAYIGLQRQPLFRFGISPNKLMDYMMAARPVLMAIEAGNDIVAEAGCGVSVAAEDAQATAQGFRRLAALTPAQRAALGEAGRAYVTARHAYPVLARRFLEALA
jgi:glycosyltransferase involved in cell wall biosynthesis